MENQKLDFFDRVKIAVAKLENYNMFLEEKVSVAVKYFFLVALILALVMSIIQTYDIMKPVSKGYEYIKNELPDFSFENGNLKFSENVYAYDEEYDMYMVSDTAEVVSDEQIQGYKEKIKSAGIIFLKDKMIYKVGTEEAEFKYAELSEQYGFGNFDKNSFVEEVQNIGIIGIASIIFTVIFISVYVAQIISLFMDCLMIAIFAYIISRICGVIMKFKHAFNISIYALTLPIIFTILYNIAYYTTGFYIEFFRTIYLLVSYVYIVAVILMMKTDLIKQQIELTKISEVQKQVHEELKEEKNKESNDDKKKEENNLKEKPDEDEIPDGEPDGSEI